MSTPQDEAERVYAASNRPVALNVRGIPHYIRAMFKSRCAREGISMEAAVIEYMKSVVVGVTPLLSKKQSHKS